MDLSARVLGKHIVDQLQERTNRPVLVIGRDRFTRGDLSGVSCFNFVAAQNLSNILAQLKVTTTADVFQTVPPSALALPHLGAVSLAVLGAAFECKGLGGERPLEAWVTKHHPADQKRDFVTFSTLKEHARDAHANRAERRAKKARQTSRRDQAHRLRVERFSRRRRAS